MKTPTKRCSRCSEVKPVADFAWRNVSKGVHDAYCRPCRSEYKREHYGRNKDSYIDQASRRWQRIRVERTQWLIDYLSVNPCVDCGESDPMVLEFDHVEDKDFNISIALSVRSWRSVSAEIAKCDVVCVNCHRRRTAERGGFARLAFLEDADENRRAGEGNRNPVTSLEG